MWGSVAVVQRWSQRSGRSSLLLKEISAAVRVTLCLSIKTKRCAVLCVQRWVARPVRGAGVRSGCRALCV